jgi:hypothetical protein
MCLFIGQNSRLAAWNKVLLIYNETEENYEYPESQYRPLSRESTPGPTEYKEAAISIWI